MSDLIRFLEVCLSPVPTGIELLGARVDYGAFCVLIVLSLSGVIFSGLVEQMRFVSTALLCTRATYLHWIFERLTT